MFRYFADTESIRITNTQYDDSHTVIPPATSDDGKVVMIAKRCVVHLMRKALGHNRVLSNQNI